MCCRVQSLHPCRSLPSNGPAEPRRSTSFVRHSGQTTRPLKRKKQRCFFFFFWRDSLRLPASSPSGRPPQNSIAHRELSRNQDRTKNTRSSFRPRRRRGRHHVVASARGTAAGFPLVGELAVDARPQLRGTGCVRRRVPPRWRAAARPEASSKSAIQPLTPWSIIPCRNDALEPGVRLRVGEVEHRDVERRVGHHVWLAGLVPHHSQDAQLLGFLELVPLRVRLRIHLNKNMPTFSNKIQNTMHTCPARARLPLIREVEYSALLHLSLYSALLDCSCSGCP